MFNDDGKTTVSLCRALDFILIHTTEKLHNKMPLPVSHDKVGETDGENFTEYLHQQINDFLSSINFITFVRLYIKLYLTVTL